MSNPQDPSTGGGPSATESSGRQSPGLVVLILAGLLIGVYVVLVILQWTHVGEGDLTWTRRSDLLSGLEALAFAAAGALFGSTVQRRETVKADQRTKDAKDSAERERNLADQATAEASRARELALGNERDAERARSIGRLLAQAPPSGERGLTETPDLLQQIRAIVQD